MKIVVLTGSPHKKGTSALLADAFIAGAEAAGHSVTRFDCAFLHIAAAVGATPAGSRAACASSGTIWAEILPALIAADLVAFVSPIYYFGLSAQLKAAIDRFYAANAQLMGGKKPRCW